ncbi:MAG: glycoside hydrolase family 55 protein [Actinomycetota bacterium]|nr:glycoside hydrolase family 55 protein [Actinomycetota bacterium]
MPHEENRRGFLRGASIGAIGFAAGLATDATAPLAFAGVQSGSNRVVAAGVSEKTRSIVSRLTSPAAAVVNVRDLGAVGDGSTDDSAAFAAAVKTAATASRLLPFGLSPDPVGSVVIDIPPGTYVIKTPGAFLGNENAPIKINGLRWRGAGNAITTIVFAPSRGDVMLRNDLWQNVQMESISFIADTKGSTFFLSKTTHNAQRYLFVNCTWENFQYGFSLQGDNNNSEFVFLDCHTSGIQDDGVFFFIGDVDASDQFVNYWFFGCTHWSTGAPFIDAAKGGQFQIYGLDASDFGSRLRSPGYLIRLRGSVHALGVCQLTAIGVRVEGKSKYAGLLRSDWPMGQVTFHNVDWSSQSNSVEAGDIIRIGYANVDGPIYSFYDSVLAGGVAVEFAISDWAHDHRISFTNCGWLQRHTPSDVVRYLAPAVNDAAQPPVRFVACRGGSGDPTGGAGSNVWDATIGYRGQLSQVLEQRVLSLRGSNGVPASGRLTANLPVGAIVTGFEVLGAPHAVTSYGTPTWTLASSESTATEIATLTASGPAAGGYRAHKDLDPPFLCSSAPRAKLVVSVSGTDQANAGALVLIHGYW